MKKEKIRIYLGYDEWKPIEKIRIFTKDGKSHLYYSFGTV